MFLYNNLQAFRQDFPNHEKKVENFGDIRIASMQCLLDKMIYPQSFDITQFFRLNQSFKNGYEKIRGFIDPIVQNSLQEERIDGEYLAEIAESLKGKRNIVFEAKELAKSGSPRTKLLLEGKIMDAKFPNEFNEKNVIVTGSDTGIGRETALEFARRGANVVFHYPPGFETGALSAEELCKEYGKKAQAFVGDFRKPDSAFTFTNNALNYLNKKVDILINNVGITFNKAFSKITENEFDSVYFVNVKSPFFLTQEVVKHMNKGGIIINMTSPHARAGMAGHSVYAGTKGSISSFTRVLAMELAPREIRVNAISPGGVATWNHFKIIPEFHIEAKDTPLEKENNPIDIAKFATLLCSPATKNLTGQVIEYDCGMDAAISADIRSTRVSNIPFGHQYI